MDFSNRVDRIRKSKNAKALFANFFSLSFLQIANYIFPLITLPYLAKVVGIENFGKIAFAQAIIVWFQTIVDYGFLYSGVRDVARCREDLDKVSVIYSNILWARVLLLLISFVLLV